MTVTGQEITDYVDRVRAALADLPPAVRDELTEDLPEHLAEVAAEGEGALVDRLGTPEAYAAELRAAAGAGEGRRPARFHRLAEARDQAATQIRLLDRQLGPVLGHETVSDFLRPLRPAWWLVRGWLAALLISVMVDGGRPGLLPRPNDNASAGLLLLIGAVVASLWLGRRSAGFTGWPRRLHRLGTAALLLFGFAVLVDVDRNASSDVYSGYEQTSVDRRYDRIEDVFVYDQQGRLIRDAQLFDQNGVPIRLGWPNCLDSSGAVPAPRNAYPYCPELAPFGAPASPSIAPPAPAPTGSATPTVPTTPAPSTSASPEPTSTR
ncbi:HAAS signaling domain-containing protein [Micromonospora aurantiaca (nom. illeg.)]|uniref:HAAS signaling domain-containing protein n=1 Tax=Micromonospora aurantiaca (nom. illeg.) TaxID=47850 RepID=UPI003EBEA334